MKKRIRFNQDGEKTSGGSNNEAAGQEQHGKSGDAHGKKQSLISHADNLNKQGEKVISDLSEFANAEQTARAKKALAELTAVLAEVAANTAEGLNKASA